LLLWGRRLRACCERACHQNGHDFFVHHCPPCLRLCTMAEPLAFSPIVLCLSNRPLRCGLNRDVLRRGVRRSRPRLRRRARHCPKSPRSMRLPPRPFPRPAKGRV
jgi:hypothetical protein